MQVRRLSRGVLEAKMGKMRFRLTPMEQAKHYRLQIFRHKENGYVGSKLIVELNEPEDLIEMAAALQQFHHLLSAMQEEQKVK